MTLDLSQEKISMDKVSTVSFKICLIDCGEVTCIVAHWNTRPNLAELRFTSCENHFDLHSHKSSYVDAHQHKATVI